MKSRFIRIFVSLLILSFSFQILTPPVLGIAPQSDPTIPTNSDLLAKTQEKVNDFNCTSVTDVPQLECEALIALYNSTNGAGWKYSNNWLSSPTVATWWGVAVSNGKVSHLSLAGNQLSGNLPPELGNLTNLQCLWLEDNQLTGLIPPEIGNLSQLEELWLNSNILTGSIPSAFRYLSNLTKLDLSSNQLTSIPPELVDYPILGLSIFQTTSFQASRPIWVI